GQLAALGHKLEDTNYEEFLKSFSNSLPASELDHINFTHPSSDLHQLLQSMRSDYEAKNLAGVVLLSDGIHNKGMSPEYAHYEFPVYTLGRGDTIPKKDLNLRTLFYNKVSYQGNKFPLVAEIDQHGFAGTKVGLVVEKNGREIQRQELTLEEELQKIEFQLEANDIGLQHYIVRIDSA